MVQQAYAALDAVITVPDEVGAGGFAVTVQLKGPSSSDLQHRAGVFAYMSNNVNGDVIALTPTEVESVDNGTDGEFIATLDGLAGYLISEADGDVDLDIVVADTKSVYLVVVLPDGQLVVSDVMTATS